MSIWTEPSPSDWDRWEELIFRADNGAEPGDAARALGFGGSSTFKRSDPVRHGEILDKWREDRKEQDRQTVRDTLRDNIRRAMEPVPILHQGKPTGYFEWAGPVALRAAELLGKDAGMFQERVDVELTGPEGGPVQIEDRSASLADVVRVLKAAGALDAELSSGTPRPNVPAALPLLPAPPDR